MRGVGLSFLIVIVESGSWCRMVCPLCIGLEIELSGCVEEMLGSM